MIKLVMFDFDGVLVNSNEAWIAVQNKLAKDAGVDRKINYDCMKPHCGKPYLDILRGIHPEAEDRNVLERMYNNLMSIASSEEFLSSIDTIKNVKGALSKLKKRYKLAIGSGNNRKILDRFLERLGLTKYFDLVVSADEVRNGKPQPDMLNSALVHFSVEPHEAVYVGDAKYDIEAARKAGMHSIAVLTGALSREEAVELQPDFIVEDATKVKEVLECLS